MRQITITIATGNAAFHPDYHPEVARILHKLADKFGRGDEPARPMDENGNRVGDIVYDEE